MCIVNSITDAISSSTRMWVTRLRCGTVCVLAQKKNTKMKKEDKEPDRDWTEIDFKRCVNTIEKALQKKILRSKNEQTK